MLRSLKRAKCLIFDAFHVLTGAGIDANGVAHVDEDRRHELAAGFNLDGFLHVGGGVAFGRRFTILDNQINVVGGRNEDWIAVEEGDRAGGVVFEVLPSVANLFSGHLMLLKRLAVHEHESVALAVKVLDIGVLDIGFFERIVAFEGTVQRRVAEKVFEFANMHRVAFAGFFEFDAGHDVGFAVDLNFETFAKVAHFICHLIVLKSAELKLWEDPAGNWHWNQIQNRLFCLDGKFNLFGRICRR